MTFRWALTPTDPLALRLAADVRLGGTDYANDIIWELDLASLTLTTLCGGHGRFQLSLSPFHSPILRTFYPNYLHVTFITADETPAEAIFWAVSSHVVAIQVTAETAVSWHGSSTRFSPAWLADPANGRYTLAIHPDAASAQQLAAQTLHRQWDDAFADIHQLNKSTPSIETGDPDWNAAFAFAYKVVLQSFVGPTPHLPHPSFIFTRVPEQGVSHSSDGHDHNWQWDGQVATEAYVTVPLIAAAAPELAQGIIRNYLAVQQANGFIDWKPGLGGQRSGRLCIPLLAAITWHLYQQTEDIHFLQEVWPGLEAFVQTWYTPAHDRDQDGVPEWQDTIHSAFDDQPSFVPWRSWGQGLAIQTAETPDLMAYLFREHVALQQIAAALGQPANPWHAERAAHLQAELAGMWQRVTRTFHFRSRDTHTIPSHVSVLELERDEGLTAVSQPVSARLEKPNVIVVRLTRPAEAAVPELDITITGNDAEGWSESEQFTASDVVWYGRYGTITGTTTWSFIDRVYITGLQQKITHIHIFTPDFSRQDQTQLLPLWAGMVSDTHRPHLVRTITDPLRYWRPYGIPNCPATDPAYAPNNVNGSGGVWMMWNTMIGEGLLAAGYRQEAMILIRRLMAAIVHTLRTDKCFREAYDADNPVGLGARDYLWGVAPCYLFLQTVGIRIVRPDRVVLSGYNPFSWPVTVRHLGVTVTRPPGKDAAADVIFPAGVSGSVVWDASNSN